MLRWGIVVFLVGLLLACGSGSAVRPTTTPASPVAMPVPTDAPEPTTVAAATVAPEPTNAPAPTDTPAPAAEPAPTEPAAATTPLQSGGLGLTRDEWEQRHGAGTQDPVMGYSYEDGEYLVSYQADSAGVETVWMIEERFGSAGISADDARAASKLLLPTDGKLTKTYTPAQGREVDLYRSSWLKDRFPATMKIGKLELSMWTNGDPGDYIVLYRVDTGKATSIVIGIGNNP